MRQSQFAGAMLGSAIGDTIGEISFIYSSKDSLLRVIDSTEKLRYTDDTAMAIGLAESIITEQGKIITQQIGSQFHSNYKKEPNRGYGAGPPRIFYQVEKTNQAYKKIAQQLFNGEGSYGNGAAMRITPLAIYAHDIDDNTLYSWVKKSAQTTHTHSLGIDGAAILAKVITDIGSNANKLTFSKDFWIDFLDKIRSFALTDVFKRKIDTIKGYIEGDIPNLFFAAQKLGNSLLAHESVPFVIYSFIKNSLDPEFSFETTLLNTILVKGDRDTVGAMVCGILGAYFGMKAIPNHWLIKLENKEYIESLAKKLYKLHRSDD